LTHWHSGDLGDERLDHLADFRVVARYCRQRTGRTADQREPVATFHVSVAAELTEELQDLLETTVERHIGQVQSFRQIRHGLRFMPQQNDNLASDGIEKTAAPARNVRGQ